MLPHGRLTGKAELVTGMADMSCRPGRRIVTTNLLRAITSVALAAVVGAGIETSAQVPFGADDGQATGTAHGASPGNFAQPPLADRPMYRFWNTGGLMTPASISEQVAQMKAAGAGGFEANQLVGIPGLSSVPGYNPIQHGFGTPAWTRAWTELFKAGKSAGLEVDEIYTPGWSAGIQGISPDQPGSAKEITFASVFLNAGETYQGAVPTTDLPVGVTKRVLQGVITYRCETNCTGSPVPVPVLDPSTAKDVTATVSNGIIRYTAPVSAGRYVLVAVWSHGTGQTIELAHTATPSYMVDHFGPYGARAIIDYWESKVLTPDLRKAFKASGGSVFLDSLELNRKDVEVRHWTDNFLPEFQQRRGYSLLPYLATVSTSSNPVFSFNNGVGERIREDYRQTLSELFIDFHINPIKSWAHAYGMTLRGQAYSSWGPGTVNAADSVMALDIPEQEANNKSNPLFAVDGSDIWRQVASANAQIGRTIVSSETGTFGRTDGLARVSLVARINEIIGLGMNKVIYHGWADQSPGAADAWPGYYPFRNFVGDNYGVQSPTFADDVTINDYVGRLQTVLRRGELRNEVAMYWGGVGAAHYSDLSLEHSGYTYGFMNDTLIADPSAKLINGKLSKLGYRTIVLTGLDSGIPMSLTAAERILSWARSGFPVIVVGNLSERVSGYHPDEDGALRQVIADLLAQKSVTKVASFAAVLSALRTAGIDSAASYDSKPLVTMHRQTPDSDYYYLFNAGADRTTASVTLKGAGTPYRYDAWTGVIRPIGKYLRTATGVRVDVDLAIGDSELIALTKGNRDIPGSECTVAATSTTADEVVARSEATPVLRDTAAGRHVTTLSSGKTLTSSIASVGAKETPESWTLEVTSWQAGAAPNDTDKVPLAPITVTPAADGTLPNWQQIVGLDNKSGTATYTTKIDVGTAWTGGTGAYLNLGSFLGTVQLKVNGHRLPPLDQVDVSKIDLGGYLQPGINTLQVDFATPIYNAGFKTKSPYGLVGPINLQPYGQVELPRECRPRKVGVTAKPRRKAPDSIDPGE